MDSERRRVPARRETRDETRRGGTRFPPKICKILFSYITSLILGRVVDGANRRRLHISSTRRLARPTPTRREEGRETSTEDARARREVCLPLGEISPQKAPRGTKRRVAHDCCSRVSLPCRFHQVVGWFARIKISRNGRSERRRDAGVATAQRSARARPRTRAVSRGGGLASLSKHVRAVVLAVRGGGVFRDSPRDGVATVEVCRHVGGGPRWLSRRGGPAARRGSTATLQSPESAPTSVPRSTCSETPSRPVARRACPSTAPSRTPRLRRARPVLDALEKITGLPVAIEGTLPPVPRRHRHQPPHRRRGHDRGQTPRPRRAQAASRGVGRVEDRPRRRGGASRGCRRARRVNLNRAHLRRRAPPPSTSTAPRRAPSSSPNSNSTTSASTSPCTTPTKVATRPRATFPRLAALELARLDSRAPVQTSPPPSSRWTNSDKTPSREKRRGCTKTYEASSSARQPRDPPPRDGPRQGPDRVPGRSPTLDPGGPRRRRRRRRRLPLLLPPPPPTLAVPLWILRVFSRVRSRGFDVAGGRGFRPR